MATQAQVRNFIAMMAPIAQRQAKKHGNKLYPSVCIAQAAHESGWGTSKKMIQANALYGVKVGKSAYKFGTAWDGSAYKTGTKEYYDGKNATKITDFFRAYSSIEAAPEDYMDMLCHCQRYSKALNCATPEQSIRAIVAGGYATGPDYAAHIMNTIRAHNLTQYDSDARPATGNPYSEPTKNVRLNSKGNDARWLQYELNKAGHYGLIIDGVAGQLTISCLMDYQKTHGLVADGICGEKTKAALRS